MSTVIDPVESPVPDAAATAPNAARSWRRSLGGGAVRRVLAVVGLLLALAAAWELYKVIWDAAGWEWPVRPDDTSMPHVWSILNALVEPARRGGDESYGMILLQEARWTFRSAIVGFALGSIVGLGLALVFLRSGLLRRGFMPYVIASQMVPLIAIAPMVVIWVRSNDWPAWYGVAAISAYLSFFPVTVNMLRGLTSPSATALELMRSYAATDTQTLARLRFPAALPYLFPALKVAATASVVGALVGELPAGLQDGLGRVLLNGAQFYVTRPEQLYAAVLVVGALGLAFAGLVGLVERVVVPGRREVVA
jgi:NitT/TauT family transport system permease protein